MANAIRPYIEITFWFIEKLVFLRLVFFANLATLRDEKLLLFLDFACRLGIIYATDQLEEDGQDAFSESRRKV
jgi:hypothetical protein